MLDFSKSKYSEETVKKQIEQVMKALNIKHMPSNREMLIATKNTSLSNVVMRSGGFKHWANKLNLPSKNSETEFGFEYENIAQNYLENMGYDVKLTPVKFPYDLLIENTTKVDVKASNRYFCPTGSSWFTFNLEANFPKCDFLVAYCIDNDRISKTYVIPAHILTGKRQLSMGDKSIYDSYKDRWDLISEHLDDMRKLGDR